MCRSRHNPVNFHRKTHKSNINFCQIDEVGKSCRAYTLNSKVLVIK